MLRYGLMAVMLAGAGTMTSGCKDVVYTIAGESDEVVQASGPMVRQVRNLTAIDEIDVCCGISVIYVQSDSLKAIVEAPESLINYVTTEISGNELVIKPSKSFRGTESMQVKVTVMAPGVNDFEASAGASIRVDDGYTVNNGKVDVEVSSGASFNMASVVASALDVECSSGASASISNIKAGKVEAEAGSGASLSLSGSVSVANLSAGGGASLSASGLQAESGSASASGGASVRSNIRNASVSSSGGGSVSNK